MPSEIHSNEKLEKRRQFFKSFEAKSLRSRSLLTQLSDDLTAVFGSSSFLVINFFVFIIWLVVNLGYVPAVEPFDPYPFGLLTMAVSLEAIFLSIFVLVSQNRSSYINSIREEVHLKVNLIAEEEITKILEVLAEVRKKVGIKEEDPELEVMLKRIDTNYIEQSIINQLNNTPTLGQKFVQELPDVLLTPIRNPVEVIQNITGNNDTDVSKKDKK
jgi:uncharacterized membrane protein